MSQHKAVNNAYTYVPTVGMMAEEAPIRGITATCVNWRHWQRLERLVSLMRTRVGRGKRRNSIEEENRNKAKATQWNTKQQTTIDRTMVMCYHKNQCSTMHAPPAWLSEQKSAKNSYIDTSAKVGACQNTERKWIRDRSLSVRMQKQNFSLNANQNFQLKKSWGKF